MYSGVYFPTSTSVFKSNSTVIKVMWDEIFCLSLPCDKTLISCFLRSSSVLESALLHCPRGNSNSSAYCNHHSICWWSSSSKTNECKDSKEKLGLLSQGYFYSNVLTECVLSLPSLQFCLPLNNTLDINHREYWFVSDSLTSNNDV